MGVRLNVGVVVGDKFVKTWSGSPEVGVLPDASSPTDLLIVDLSGQVAKKLVRIDHREVAPETETDYGNMYYYRMFDYGANYALGGGDLLHVVAYDEQRYFYTRRNLNSDKCIYKDKSSNVGKLQLSTRFLLFGSSNDTHGRRDAYVSLNPDDLTTISSFRLDDFISSLSTTRDESLLFASIATGGALKLHMFDVLSKRRWEWSARFDADEDLFMSVTHVWVVYHDVYFDGEGKEVEGPVQVALLKVGED